MQNKCYQFQVFSDSKYVLCDTFLFSHRFCHFNTFFYEYCWLIVELMGNNLFVDWFNTHYTSFETSKCGLQSETLWFICHYLKWFVGSAKSTLEDIFKILRFICQTNAIFICIYDILFIYCFKCYNLPIKLKII